MHNFQQGLVIYLLKFVCHDIHAMYHNIYTGQIHLRVKHYCTIAFFPDHIPLCFLDHIRDLWTTRRSFSRKWSGRWPGNKASSTTDITNMLSGDISTSLATVSCDHVCSCLKSNTQLLPSTTFVHSILPYMFMTLLGTILARVNSHCLLELHLQFPWPPLHRFSDIHVPAIGSCGGNMTNS